MTPDEHALRVLIKTALEHLRAESQFEFIISNCLSYTEAQKTKQVKQIFDEIKVEPISKYSYQESWYYLTNKIIKARKKWVED